MKASEGTWRHMKTSELQILKASKLSQIESILKVTELGPSSLSWTPIWANERGWTRVNSLWHLQGNSERSENLLIEILNLPPISRHSDLNRTLYQLSINSLSTLSIRLPFRLSIWEGGTSLACEWLSLLRRVSCTHARPPRTFDCTSVRGSDSEHPNQNYKL